MRVFVTETRKLLGLRPAVGAVVAALVLTPLLTWVNARSVRAAIEGVRADVDADPAGLGVSEALLSVAASAALGVLVVWQEYRPMPEELGGGHQAAMSELAVPARIRRCLAKYVLAALAGGQSIDFGNLSSVASQLLSDNGGSVHNLAASLLGSGAPGGVDVSNGVSSDILSNIAGTVFSGGVAGVDLSDGIGLDDVMGFASFLMGKK